MNENDDIMLYGKVPEYNEYKVVSVDYKKMRVVFDTVENLRPAITIVEPVNNMAFIVNRINVEKKEVELVWAKHESEQISITDAIKKDSIWFALKNAFNGNVRYVTYGQHLGKTGKESDPMPCGKKKKGKKGPKK